MKILNFASANVDYVYTVSHIVRPGETISSPKIEIFPGGKGLNQSVAAARAGANIYHAGFIGTDGDILKDILQQSGVKLDFLNHCDSKNGHAIIQVNSQAENCIVIYQGTNGMFSKTYIDSVLEHFSADDFVMVQNEVNNLPYIMESACAKGMQIVLNPSPFDESLRELDLNLVAYLILNETEAAGFFGTQDVEQIVAVARDKYPGMKLVLTLGSKGCVYADEKQMVSCPAFMVKPVDTTAAGDTFTGYFVAQLAAGRSVRRALCVSCAASALAVSTMGAAPSIPLMATVQEKMNLMRQYPAEQLKRHSMLGKIESIVNSDLTGISLEKLAKALGYSVSYTGTLIKSVTGESYLELVHRLRCNRARELLKDTDLSVGDIIQTVGYKNESYFRTVFKRQFGNNPLEYRKTER